jgi:hypothetical protein
MSLTAIVPGSRRVGCFRVPPVDSKIGITTSNHEPVNGIRGHEPTDFTTEFAQRCHPASQDVLGALRQRSHLGSRKSPTKKVLPTEQGLRRECASEQRGVGNHTQGRNRLDFVASPDTPWRPVTPHSPSFLFLARARQVGSGQHGSAQFLSHDNCVAVKVSTCQVERTQVTSHYPR